MSNKQAKIAVLGAGSWGTALACLLVNNGHDVTLWSRSQEHVNELSSLRVNKKYLPETKLPNELKFSANLQQICADHTTFLLVIPSHSFRSTLEKIKDYGIKENSLFMWGTKGFDATSLSLLSDLIDDIFGNTAQQAIVTGPSFAKEVIAKLPTALTVSSPSEDIANLASEFFHNSYTRVYTNPDLIGVQVGGAVKNVLAIACGISDGLGYGANSKAALITRGLAEITRLGTALGACKETFQGLSGLGDLVLTCTDDKSRNRRFGLAIGNGVTITAAKDEIGQEIEGIITSREVFLLAKKHAVEMPICEQVYQILHNSLSPQIAVSHLLQRISTSE